MKPGDACHLLVVQNSYGVVSDKKVAAKFLGFQSGNRVIEFTEAVEGLCDVGSVKVLHSGEKLA